MDYPPAFPKKDRTLRVVCGAMHCALITAGRIYNQAAFILKPHPAPPPASIQQCGQLICFLWLLLETLLVAASAEFFIAEALVRITPHPPRRSCFLFGFFVFCKQLVLNTIETNNEQRRIRIRVTRNFQQISKKKIKNI